MLRPLEPRISAASPALTRATNQPSRRDSPFTTTPRSSSSQCLCTALAASSSASMLARSRPSRTSPGAPPSRGPTNSSSETPSAAASFIARSSCGTSRPLSYSESREACISAAAPTASCVSSRRSRAAFNRSPNSSEKVEDDSWRVRVGDYRIIYTIDDRAATIQIIATSTSPRSLPITSRH